MNAPNAEPDALEVARQDLVGRRADPAVHDQAVLDGVRPVHPQHLRAHRDHVAEPRRALRRRLAGGRGLGRALGGCADLQHGRADPRRRRRGAAARRGRRDRDDRAAGGGGLLEQAGGDRRTPSPAASLHTGDVGYMDAQGWFYIVDRKKDQINAGGYKVWPREVEDVLFEHEAVREAAVVGVPDEYRGETVKAFVSLKAGQDRHRGGADRLLQGAGWRPTSTRARSSSWTRCPRPSRASSCGGSCATARRTRTARPGGRAVRR